MVFFLLKTDQAVIHHGDEPSHKKTKYDDTGLDTNRKKTNDGVARPLTEGLEKKKGVGRNSEIELSADQTRFLTQYEYIVLSEWRALAPNSLRVLHPTTNDDDGFYYEWFYVGPPPYNTLCSSGPKEKLWPLFPSGDM